MNNEIIDALNSLFGKQVFKMEYCVCDVDCHDLTEIRIELVYLPAKLTVLSTKIKLKKVCITESLIKVLYCKFNEDLIKNMLFGLPTKGKCYDSCGRPVLTIADVINDLKNEFNGTGINGIDIRVEKLEQTSSDVNSSSSAIGQSSNKWN